MKNKQNVIVVNYFKRSGNLFEQYFKKVLLHKSMFVSLIFLMHFAYGQEANLGQFAIWKAKDGQTRKFEEGYKRHLNWHKTNNDPWGWYGWFFISGPRYGQFADATFDHSWSDFDKAVKPADDIADNRVNVFPFGDVQTIFKVAEVTKASTKGTEMKTRLVKLITLTVGDVEQSLIIIEKLKDYYLSKQIKFFKTYKVVDGGDANQIILMLGFDNWEDYALSEGFNHKISVFQRDLKMETVRSIVSETMVYRADMSFFPN